MKRIDTMLPGVCIVEPMVHGDQRGYFMETYNRQAFADIGITAEFVQDNQSYTASRGVLRGIHFQNAPMAQAKLVRVTRGAVLDVTVDLRKGSPTYRQWVGVELSEENKRMLFIPRGFGHGFVTLTDILGREAVVEGELLRADLTGGTVVLRTKALPGAVSSQKILD